MKRSEIENKMYTYGVGKFGLVIVSDVNANSEMNKTLNGKRSMPNPYLNRVVKRTIAKNVKIGCEFANFINRKVGNGKKYDVDCRRGMEYVVYPFIVRGIVSQKEFLTFPYRLCDVRTTFESKYYLDGKEMTDVQLADMKRYFKPKSNYSKKQDSFSGNTLTEKEMTSVLNYDVRGIHYLATNAEEGEKIYKNAEPITDVLN